MTTRTYLLGLSDQHVSVKVPEDYAVKVGEFGLWV